MDKINVFLSSVGADEAFRLEIKKRLKILEREGAFDFRDEQEELAGEDWQKNIKDHLEQAAIVLLLISPDYLASDFHFNEVIVPVKEKLVQGKCKVLPIHIRPVTWDDLPIRELHPIPYPDPVSSWANADEAYFNVKEAIQAVLENYTQEMEGSTQVSQRHRRSDVTCPMCGKNIVDKEEKLSLEFDDNESGTGYVISGKAKMHYDSKHICCNCGNIFDRVERTVRVENRDRLKCPICEKDTAMKFSIVPKSQDDYLTFRATWDCRFCNYFKPLAKSLKFIREIAGIFVKKDNIELVGPSKLDDINQIY